MTKRKPYKPTKVELQLLRRIARGKGLTLPEIEGVASGKRSSILNAWKHLHKLGYIKGRYFCHEKTLRKWYGNRKQGGTQLTERGKKLLMRG